MIIISPERLGSVSATSEDGAFPADNLLDDKPLKRWQSGGSASATITAVVAAYSDQIAIFGTNAISASIAIKVGGVTQETFTIDLTSPHLCNRFWQSYTEQTVSHTVEITLTASGSAVYAGVLRIGSGLVLKNPRYGLSEGRRNFSIVKELNNGAYYIRRRPAVRTYNIAFDTLADSGDYYDFAAVYDDKGPEPIAVLVAENMDDNEFAIFGHIIQPFSGNYENYGKYNMSYQITEAV